MDLDMSLIKPIVEFIVLAIAGVVATAAVLLRAKLASTLIKFLEKKLNWKIFKSNTHLNKKEIAKDIQIQDSLAELRIKATADRSYVFQFHNGNMFTCKNQMWKLSCTHESVSSAIKPNIGELQNILSSSVSSLLYPLWEENTENFHGVERISPDYCQCTRKDICKAPVGVYLYVVEKLSPGYAKGLLVNHSVLYMLQAPLLDAQDNRIGFIGLDYCWEESNIEEIKSCAELLCTAAHAIAYELQVQS